MAFTWFDKFTEGLLALPSKEEQDELIVAIVRYGIDGAEPDLSSPLLSTCFAFVRGDISSSRAKHGGKAGGRPRKSGGKQKTSPENTPKNIPENVSENTSDTSPENVSENTEFLRKEGNEGSKGDEMREGDEVGNNPLNPPFHMQCLKALNDVLVTTFTTMPERCRLHLERHAGDTTVDQVRQMVEAMRDDWQGTQFRVNLTPNTLFSPDHFEQYMHRVKSEEVANDEYSIYDQH